MSKHRYSFKRVTTSGVKDYERFAGSVAEIKRAVSDECDDHRLVYPGFFEGTSDGVAVAYYYERVY